jgi:hypothetical protein
MTAARWLMACAAATSIAFLMTSAFSDDPLRRQGSPSSPSTSVAGPFNTTQVQRELELLLDQVLAIAEGKHFVAIGGRPTRVAKAPGPDQVAIEARGDTLAGWCEVGDSKRSIACDAQRLGQLLATDPGRRVALFVLAHEVGHVVQRTLGFALPAGKSTSVCSALEKSHAIAVGLDAEQRADEFAAEVLARVAASEAGGQMLMSGALRQHVEQFGGSNPVDDAAPLPASDDFVAWRANELLCQCLKGALPQAEVAIPGTHPDFASRASSVALRLAGQRPGASGCTGVTPRGDARTVPGLASSTASILSVLDCEFAEYRERVGKQFLNLAAAYTRDRKAPTCGLEPPAPAAACVPSVARWKTVRVQVPVQRRKLAQTPRQMRGHGRASLSLDATNLIVTAVDGTEATVLMSGDQEISATFDCKLAQAAFADGQIVGVCAQLPRVVVVAIDGSKALSLSLDELGETGDTVPGATLGARTVSEWWGGPVVSFVTPGANAYPQQITVDGAKPFAPWERPNCGRQRSLGRYRLYPTGNHRGLAWTESQASFDLLALSGGDEPKKILVEPWIVGCGPGSDTETAVCTEQSGTVSKVALTTGKAKVLGKVRGDVTKARVCQTAQHSYQLVQDGAGTLRLFRDAGGRALREWIQPIDFSIACSSRQIVAAVASAVETELFWQ